jgi:hypothetical protein
LRLPFRHIGFSHSEKAIYLGKIGIFILFFHTAHSNVLESDTRSERECRSTRGAMKRRTKRERRDAALKASPAKETFTDARSRYAHSHREWRIVRLRQLIEQYKGEQAKAIGDQRLPDNWFSHGDKRIGADIFTEIDSLWRDLSAELERAVLNGDANWFERQARAIRGIGSYQRHGSDRAQFEIAVMREIEIACLLGDEPELAAESTNPNRELIEQRKSEQAGMTKEQIIERKRKPYAFAKGAEQ